MELSTIFYRELKGLNQRETTLKSDLFSRFLDSREKSLEKNIEKTLEKKSPENAPIFSDRKPLRYPLVIDRSDNVVFSRFCNTFPGFCVDLGSYRYRGFALKSNVGLK